RSAKYLSKPSTFCCTMSIPIMHATARRTSSVTPKRTELSRFSARVTTEGVAAAARAFGTATWVLVSSIADILMNCELQNGHESKGTGRSRQGTKQFATRIITKAGRDGNFIRLGDS